MADPRKIEVRIAATGGEQAAAEIRKVDQAIGGNGGRGGIIENHRELFTSQNKVSASSANMRGNLQNVAFQFQDIAVQAEMGTSAVRIFSQQVPQMLGGFGAVGAIAGAVIGIGVPLGAALLGAGNAAKESKKGVDDLTEALEDYAEAQKKASQERSSEKVAAWFESLDQEEEYWKNINTQIELAIQNQAKLRALQLGADAARRDLEIARIESDPTLSDAEKTKQITAFRERDAKERAAEEIAKLQDAAKIAGARYTGAEQASTRQQADAAEASRKRQEIEAAQKAEVERARIASEAIPKIQKDIAAAETAQRFAINPETGETTPAYAQFQKQIDDLKRQLQDARTAVGENITPEQRAAKLGKDAADLEAAKKAEQDQITQAKKAREEEEKLLSDKLQAEAAARSQAPIIEDRYRSESEARRVRSEAKMREQEERDRSKAEAEAAKKKADAAKKEAAGERESLSGIRRTGAEARIGRDAEKLLPDGVKQEFRDAVTKAARGLQDGDQGGEVKELVGLMNQLANAVQVKGTQTAGEIAALKRTVGLLQAQTKNARK